MSDALGIIILLASVTNLNLLGHGALLGHNYNYCIRGIALR